MGNNVQNSLHCVSIYISGHMMIYDHVTFVDCAKLRARKGPEETNTEQLFGGVLTESSGLTGTLKTTVALRVALWVTCGLEFLLFCLCVFYVTVVVIFKYF